MGTVITGLTKAHVVALHEVLGKDPLVRIGRDSVEFVFEGKDLISWLGRLLTDVAAQHKGGYPYVSLRRVAEKAMLVTGIYEY